MSVYTPVVVLLCGMPASGKSTLARELLDRYSEQSTLISFDAYEVPRGISTHCSRYV